MNENKELCERFAEYLSDKLRRRRERINEIINNSIEIEINFDAEDWYCKCVDLRQAKMREFQKWLWEGELIDWKTIKRSHQKVHDYVPTSEVVDSINEVLQRNSESNPKPCITPSSEDQG